MLEFFDAGYGMWNVIVLGVEYVMSICQREYIVGIEAHRHQCRGERGVRQEKTYRKDYFCAIKEPGALYTDSDLRAQFSALFRGDSWNQPALADWNC